MTIRADSGCKKDIWVIDVLFMWVSMSTEEFVREVRERHKEDIEAIERLLDILKDLNEEDRKVYDFCVTSNL